MSMFRYLHSTISNLRSAIKKNLNFALAYLRNLPHVIWGVYKFNFILYVT